MNEGMVEIKALNLILSLLYMLILVSWICFHIAVHSAVDAQEGKCSARPPYVIFNKIHLFETR